MINKIVFTSLEAMVEFSGKELKPKRLSKTPIYIRLKGQGIFSFRLAPSRLFMLLETSEPSDEVARRRARKSRETSDEILVSPA